MEAPRLHRFEKDGRYFAIDTHTCFCFECDHISRDVLAYYPHEPVNRIYHLLKDKHPRKELEEVIGELEWLRVTKAILTPQDDQAFLEQATRAGGLRQLVLSCHTTREDRETLSRAGLLLLARSGAEKTLKLSLSFGETSPPDWTRTTAALAEMSAAARLAGKRFRVELDIPFRPLPESASEAADCTFRCKVVPPGATIVPGFMDALFELVHGKPAALKAFRNHYAPESLRITARPLSEQFHRLVESLHKAGYPDIEIDLPGAWMAQPRLDPEAVVDALEANAVYYAEQLLKNNLFRVEPLASLFNAIHGGTPCYRTDPSAIEVLAADKEGRLYPSLPFAGNPKFVLGTLAGGRLEEDRLESFLFSGALQTPACLRCWARGLCGGGHTAIHYARTGNAHTPDPAWCEAQRRWIGAAVAAFNRISSAGIHFEHLLGAMQPKTRPLSLLGATKALLRGHLSVRPLREDDAPTLVRWENWNRSAYFLCNETGALTATHYDREMDALHPPLYAQELLVTRLNGTPCGLLKLQPVPEKRMARAWLYMHDTSMYAKSALRTTLRQLLAEVCRGKQLRHVLTPVTKAETALAEALLAAGFTHAGTQREALYQRGAYQDVDIYIYSEEA